MNREAESRIQVERGTTISRKIWKAVTWFMTWWIPSFCLSCCGIRGKAIQQAWREKVALFILFVSASAFLLFFIIGIPRLVCPKQNIKSLYEIELLNKPDNAHVAANGRYYDITDIYNSHAAKYSEADTFKMQSLLGKDVSEMFYPAMSWDSACPGITNPGASWDNLIQRNDAKFPAHMQSSPDTQLPINYLGYMAKFARGKIGWTAAHIASINNPTIKLITMYKNVYNVAPYFNGQSKPGFFDDNMWNIFSNVEHGKDATAFMDQLRAQNPVYYRNVKNCMDNLLYVGVVDERGSSKCTIADSIMFGASIIICCVIGIKFLAAFRFGESTNPAKIDRYVMVQIPCYTENRKSLEFTLNSIATADFDDTRKLAVIICDGIVTGAGNNNKPTHEIVLDILYGGEVEANVAKENAHPPMTYHAVAEGRKAENKAQIFSGLYNCEGHELPFIVIVKTGNETEKSKPGNRGKRDSQIMLMRFLHNVYARNALTEFEYGMYHEMKDVMGVAPEMYEFMLMVDADTSISKEAMNKLVYHMIKDEDIAGLSGETLVANENESWAARIQPYEYFTSHHLAKAFESMFGCVTCLPGCFCMYRIRTAKYDPVLVAPSIIDDYSIPDLDTLHKMNLLKLGEDRYLTTTMLKHHTGMTTRYTSDAHCYSTVPSTFGVLLSQRRRWINSTIHNLVELVGVELCGFGCFSMRFIVFLDICSTIVAPASVGYVAYLIGIIIYNQYMKEEQAATYMISVIMIAAIYGLQLIIIIMKMKWQYIAYMAFYIVAMPYFSFYMPLYSFWHMDDFNWGNTRVAITNGKEEVIIETFDAASIPRKKISEWEVLFKNADHDDEIAFKNCIGNDKMAVSNNNIGNINNNINTAYPFGPTMTTGAPIIPPPVMTTMPAMSMVPGMQPQHIPGVGMGIGTHPMTTAPYPMSYYAPSQAPSNYAHSHYASSVVGGNGMMHGMMNGYTPSHVASYVGNVYPVPSTYAPSSYGGEVELEEMSAEEIARQKREKRERRERRRQKKEERERKEQEERERERLAELERKQEEDAKKSQKVEILLPVVEKEDDGWDTMLTQFDRK